MSRPFPLGNDTDGPGSAFQEKKRRTLFCLEPHHEIVTVATPAERLLRTRHCAKLSHLFSVFPPQGGKDTLRTCSLEEAVS